MQIKPLNDSVIFEFLDTISSGAFAAKTKSGIILTNKNSDDNAQLPRWGKVFAVGPSVSEVKEGDYILIAPLRWTLGFKLNDKQLSKTIEKEILMVAENVANESELFI